jgi:hypothetical protein
LAARIARIESALAARAPIEPALIWRCGAEITPADRRAAAKAAGERGTPNAVIIFVRFVDASRPDRHAPTPAEIEAAKPTRIDALRAHLRTLSHDRARNAITEMHVIGRIDADEAETLRRDLREPAA